MITREQILELVSCTSAVCYWDHSLRTVRGYSFTYDEIVTFAHAVIDRLKSELIKGAGEPSCWMTPDGEGWRMRTKPPEIETKLGWMSFYNSDQLAAAVMAATGKLEEENLAARTEIEQLHREYEQAITLNEPEYKELRQRIAELESPAVSSVIAERRRQVEVEGWTPEHDDQHTIGELAVAAACYAATAGCVVWADDIPSFWPWSHEWWKPSRDDRRNLVKACALGLAEIERIDRAAAQLQEGEKK